MKFVPNRAEDVTLVACERLAEIQYYSQVTVRKFFFLQQQPCPRAKGIGTKLIYRSVFQSAELYLGIEMVKEAIDMFIDGELWAKAKKCAADMAPKLV